MSSTLMQLINDTKRPLVMGILNVTPDSFSDGNRFLSKDAALERARQMIEEGADILDVGGESTRPGATPVTVEQELERVLPVIEAIAPLGIPVSVDTSKPEVMRAAAKAGAALINDVRALREPGAMDAARASDLPVCLMHMQGEPRSMQQAPHYTNVVDEVSKFLLQRADSCIQAGIAKEKILLDPGIGFGKTLAHNLQLMKHLRELCSTAYPVLVGVSRKSMIGAVTGQEVHARMAGSLAAAQYAACQGAAVLRVHDVAETRDMVKMLEAIEQAD